jgi:c-di-GMP-binding flagellar brake protein YcgR
MLLGEARIKCRARITNVRAKGKVFMTGVEFIEMSEEDREILQSYLTWEYFL